MTTHVQDVTNSTTPGSASQVVTITTSAGSLLMLATEAYIAGNNPLNIVSVTDTAGNNWVIPTAASQQQPPAAGVFNGSNYAFAAAAYCPGAKAVTSVTVTLNATPGVGMLTTVTEFSGAPSNAVLDASAATSGTTTGQTSQVTPSVTLSGRGDALIAQTAESIGWTSVGSPWTLSTSSTDCAWQVATGGGSTAATFSGSSQTFYASVTLAVGPPAPSALPALVPVPPGRLSPASWPRIQPPPPPQPPNVLVPAGAASATATALSPVAVVSPNPGTATATATALQPATVIAPAPGTASATATAQSPVPNVIPNPGSASATATALNPSILTGTVASPTAATATATALSPSLQISNTIAAGLATATATALQPVIVITPGAGLAHAVATAQSPTASVSTTVTPGVAHAVATASSPGFAQPLNHFAVTFTEPGPTATLTENAFGATLTEQKLGAALTLASFGGSLVPVSPSATCTIPGYGATLSLSALGAVLTEGTMQQASLTLSEFNDMTINIAVTNNGSPYNLTSQNLNLLLKSQAGVPDSQALVFSSTGGSPAITITNASQGLATAQLPNTSLNSETYNFYRLDVVNASLQQQTTVYGPIVWVTL